MVSDISTSDNILFVFVSTSKYFSAAIVPTNGKAKIRSAMFISKWTHCWVIHTPALIVASITCCSAPANHSHNQAIRAALYPLTVLLASEIFAYNESRFLNNRSLNSLPFAPTLSSNISKCFLIFAAIANNFSFFDNVCASTMLSLKLFSVESTVLVSRFILLLGDLL